ncbi:MAG: DeoR/GlpR transcriptional regulator [Firmicutes bacterium]|nr:DeoR/GlpR transcriptional regulator [Bacillota bacterium]
MFTIERLQRIRRILLEKKRVEVTELSQVFGVSESTIRRDLDKLEKEGFLRKTYGGAVLAEDSVVAPEDNDPLTMERTKIARLAADMVGEGEAIFLGGGPVCLRLAACLAGRQRLTVVTNDLEIAVELAEAPYVNVKVTGGELIPGTFSLAGSGALESIRGLCFNKPFLAPTGADLKFGYAVPTLGEAQLIRAVTAVTQEIVALLDRTVFGRLALAPVAGLAEIPTVVTTNLLPHDFKAFYLAHQVKVFTAYELAQPGARR